VLCAAHLRILLGCLLAAAEKPAENKASAQEINYRATGTEPFWGMSVTQRELRLTWPEPEPSVATAYTLEEHADGRTYKGAAFTAVVTYKTCSDGMSDRAYPHTVTVQLADRVLKGCGWPAGYDLGPPP
jgi:heat shock protein HslJ